MSEALATDAPAQAAAIATEEVQHPVEDGDTTMSSTKAEPDLASYVKGSEVEPAGEVKAELKPTVKLVIEKPAVKDRSAEEVDELLAKAAKQGTLPTSLRYLIDASPQSASTSPIPTSPSTDISSLSRHATRRAGYQYGQS